MSDRRRSTPVPGEPVVREMPEDAGPTKRVLLKRERVIVIPEDVAPEKLAEAYKVLGIKGKLPDVLASRGPHEAWLVVGEVEGSSKDAAIYSHTGRPGTADAKVGAWKAPPASGWAGGVLLKAPPKPLVEREALD